jgi:hypothetical protein
MLKLSDIAVNEIPIRLVYLGFGVAAFLLVYSTGASVSMSHTEAQNIAGDFMEHAGNIDQEGIFWNNVKVAVGMFVPGFGAWLGGYAAFETGMTFKALATVNPSLGSISPLMVLATPFGALEVPAYGLAMSRSAMLVVQLLRTAKLWRQFTLFTVVELAIVVVVLLAGAAIEWMAVNPVIQ